MLDFVKEFAFSQIHGCLRRQIVIIKAELDNVAQVGGPGQIFDTLIHYLILAQVELAEIPEGVDLDVLAPYCLETVISHPQLCQVEVAAE